MKPDKPLDGFVESFWLLCNQSERNKEIIVLPDGRIDLTFFQSIKRFFEQYFRE
ncbi:MULTISPECIES: DUF6597 domain-containing transcriptional factor [Chitinophagaceae]